MQFHIDNMTCGGCARGVTRAVQSVDPEAVVKTDPPTRQVEVISSRPTEAIIAALTQAGFQPR
ncbi:MAG TPA: heavy-metal-associated domain-containing protein [Luteimonas sp.]|nr:heavy-metal-associated domain-containing protein [Luteimonas sp.]HRO27590.1 heavy-metal-associated domain-containing protein [Luteimonas sp.]HRP73489.1 heavy-metal-associated domain-containing protein [Luteimonas sp.]